MVILRGLAGAVIGGVLGWFAFEWLMEQGFYGLALPGALIGIGCGLLSGGTSELNGVLCAAAAAIVALILEWRHFPFVADESFGYFVTHLHQVRGIAWLMVVLGAVFGFWFGRGRSRYPR
jgi:hypothetical protein